MPLLPLLPHLPHPHPPLPPPLGVSSVSPSSSALPLVALEEIVVVVVVVIIIIVVDVVRRRRRRRRHRGWVGGPGCEEKEAVPASCALLYICIFFAWLWVLKDPKLSKNGGSACVRAAILLPRLFSQPSRHLPSGRSSIWEPSGPGAAPSWARGSWPQLPRRACECVIVVQLFFFSSWPAHPLPHTSSDHPPGLPKSPSRHSPAHRLIVYHPPPPPLPYQTFVVW